MRRSVSRSMLNARARVWMGVWLLYTRCVEWAKVDDQVEGRFVVGSSIVVPSSLLHDR